jgi:hypothetical protein
MPRCLPKGPEVDTERRLLVPWLCKETSNKEMDMNERVGQAVNTPGSAEVDEPVLHSARRHWAVFFPPFVLLIFAGLSVPSKGTNAWIIIGISLVWIVLTSISYQASEIRLTRTKILVTVGLPRRKTSFILLSTIGVADVYQPALGKLLDFGRVRLRLMDGSTRYLRMINAPNALAAKISALKAALEEEK